MKQFLAQGVHICKGDFVSCLQAIGSVVKKKGTQKVWVNVAQLVVDKTARQRMTSPRVLAAHCVPDKTDRQADSFGARCGGQNCPPQDDVTARSTDWSLCCGISYVAAATNVHR